MHAISALLLLAGPGAALIAQRPAPRQRHCNTLAATTADKKATRETRRQIKARKKASPTSLGDDLCLIPGEVVVRVDAAPGNARRIYTGVDISADVDTVWDLLTDYEGLADVVPNLVANEVIAKPPGGGGARLRQVGSAQVLPGVNFKASMVLDVAEVRGGLAAGQIRRGELDRVDAATEDGIRATEKKERLERGLFPRPWAAATSDPAFNRDITMVSVPGEPGDFTLYQGLWRAQPLPDCGPEDQTRLTFAVEIQPRPWLPVALVENRIAGDLVKNLEAVAVEAAVRYRDAAEKRAAAADAAAGDGADDAAPAPPAAPAPAPAAEVPPPSKPTPQTETAVADAKAGLLAAVARVSDAGLGCSREDADRVAARAAALGAAAEALDAAGPRKPPGGGLQPAIFDAKRFAGAWAVAYSSQVAETTMRGRDARPAAPPSLLLAPPPGAPPAAPRSPRRSRGAKPVTEVDVATSAFRLFPRTTETLGRFALKSVDLDVRPGPNGDAVDTIVSFRSRATPLLPAPALRLEHALVAPRAPFAATLINDRVRLEPADGDARLTRVLPKPSVPTSWLPTAAFRNRLTNFVVVYADDDLLVTRADDGDVRVCLKAST